MEGQKQPPGVPYERGVFENFAKFTGEHLCQGLLFNKVARFIKKQALAQLFSCGFCEIFKNTFFREHLRITASGRRKALMKYLREISMPLISILLNVCFVSFFFSFAL